MIDFATATAVLNVLDNLIENHFGAKSKTTIADP